MHKIITRVPGTRELPPNNGDCKLLCRTWFGCGCVYSDIGVDPCAGRISGQYRPCCTNPVLDSRELMKKQHSYIEKKKGIPPEPNCEFCRIKPKARKISKTEWEQWLAESEERAEMEKSLGGPIENLEAKMDKIEKIR